MITRITVVCDNPAHAGKVATVAVYRNFPDEGWEREHSFRRQPKRRAAGQDGRRANAFAKAAKSGDPNQIAAALSGDRRGRPACKLCGLEFLPESAVRLSFFAAQGMSRISIWQLRGVR